MPKFLKDMGIETPDALRERLSAAAAEAAPKADDSAAAPAAPSAAGTDDLPPVAEDFRDPETGEVDRKQFGAKFGQWLEQRDRNRGLAEAEEAEHKAVGEAVNAAPARLRKAYGDTTLEALIAAEAASAMDDDRPATPEEVRAALDRLVAKDKASVEARIAELDAEQTETRQTEPTNIPASASAKPSVTAAGGVAEAPLDKALRLGREQQAALAKARGVRP